MRKCIAWPISRKYRHWSSSHSLYLFILFCAKLIYYAHIKVEDGQGFYLQAYLIPGLYCRHLPDSSFTKYSIASIFMLNTCTNTNFKNSKTFSDFGQKYWLMYTKVTRTELCLSLGDEQLDWLNNAIGHLTITLVSSQLETGLAVLA